MASANGKNRKRYVTSKLDEMGIHHIVTLANQKGLRPVAKDLNVPYPTLSKWVRDNGAKLEFVYKIG